MSVGIFTRGYELGHVFIGLTAIVLDHADQSSSVRRILTIEPSQTPTKLIVFGVRD